MAKGPKIVELRFPIGGLVRRYGYQSQAPYTTPDCENVVPRDVLENRERGGRRVLVRNRGPGAWRVTSRGGPRWR